MYESIYQQANPYFFRNTLLLHYYIIDKDLKFHAHTSASVKKANQILGLMKKTVRTKNETTIPLLYMSLMRHLLEYANVVWSPHYKGHQQMLEKVQKRATKMIEKPSSPTL